MAFPETDNGRVLAGGALRGGFVDGANGWGREVNHDLLILSVLISGVVKSRTTTPPASGADGDVYIVPSGDPTNPNKIAVWDNPSADEPVQTKGWVYLEPQKGFTVRVEDDSNGEVWYDGSVWTNLPGGSGTATVLDDGTVVSTSVTKFNFTGGTVTDDGSGQVSVPIGGGSGSGDINYKTVAALQASTEASRGDGAVWEAEGFRYWEVANPVSSFPITLEEVDLETAGGVYLMVQPADDGTYPLPAWGVKGDGVFDDRDMIQLACERMERIGGGIIKGRPGAVHYCSDKVYMNPGSVLDLGEGADMGEIKFRENRQAFVFLPAGAGIRAKITDRDSTADRGSELLLVSDDLNQRFYDQAARSYNTDLGRTWFDVHLIGPDATGIQRGNGVEIHSSLGDGSVAVTPSVETGVQFLKGRAYIEQVDEGLIIETDTLYDNFDEASRSYGLINDCDLDFTMKGGIKGIRVQMGGDDSIATPSRIFGNNIRFRHEVDANTLKTVSLEDGFPASTQARFDFNQIDLHVFNWDGRDPAGDGTALLLNSQSEKNQIVIDYDETTEPASTLITDNGTNNVIRDVQAGTLDGLSVSGSGGATTFTGLTDTPSTFGTAQQVAWVNTAGDALEWRTLVPGDVGAATAAQGALADTALQPGEEQTDLSGLGTFDQIILGTNLTGTDNADGTVTINAAGGSGTTDLTWTASTRTLASSSGTDAVITLADATNAGLMASADKTKLDGVETSATADQTAQEIATAIDADATAEATLVSALGVVQDTGDLEYVMQTKTASYTLVAGDAGSEIEFNAGTAVTVTIPASTFTRGQWLEVSQIGAGTLTIAGASGVTVNPPPGDTLSLAGQHGIAAIKCRGGDVFAVYGTLAKS